VATHAIGHHTQVARIVKRPTVFVNWPDATLVRYTERAHHACVIGASRLPNTAHLVIWSFGHLVIVAQLGNSAIEQR
jgi:hypothetical protein